MAACTVLKPGLEQLESLPTAAEADTHELDAFAAAGAASAADTISTAAGMTRSLRAITVLLHP
jgi:hypothetical protein